jgi:hypothetical protein
MSIPDSMLRVVAPGAANGKHTDSLAKSRYVQTRRRSHPKEVHECKLQCDMTSAVSTLPAHCATVR